MQGYSGFVLVGQCQKYSQNFKICGLQDSQLARQGVLKDDFSRNRKLVALDVILFTKKAVQSYFCLNLF